MQDPDDFEHTFSEGFCSCSEDPVAWVFGPWPTRIFLSTQGSRQLDCFTSTIGALSGLLKIPQAWSGSFQVSSFQCFWFCLVGLCWGGSRRFNVLSHVNVYIVTELGSRFGVKYPVQTRLKLVTVPQNSSSRGSICARPQPREMHLGRRPAEKGP